MRSIMPLVCLWGALASSAFAQDEPTESKPEIDTRQSAAPQTAGESTASTIPLLNAGGVGGSSDGPKEATSKDKPPGNRFIEEIVVTAQKREENLQDVPIAVTAFTGSMLDARGIDNPKDLQTTMPGLTYNEIGGFSIVYLRGVGSDAFFMADPSVATYIDGVYMPSAQGLAQNFGALERIEVLKGPQGTLFGRNAVGGAINIITKSPGPNPELSLQSSYESFDTFKNRIYANIPLSSSFAISTSAFYNVGNFYYDGSADGMPLPKEISKGARLKLKWTPLEGLDLAAAGFILRQTGASSEFLQNGDPNALAIAAGVTPQTGYHGSVNSPTFIDLTNRVVYGSASYRTNWFDVKLLGSHQAFHDSYELDYDGSTQPLEAFHTKDQFAHATSAELQFVSNASSWGHRWLEWIGGAYYFRSQQGFNPVDLVLANLNLQNGTLLNVPLPPELISGINQIATEIPGIGLPTGGLALIGILDTNSVAGFAQTTIHFTDWLSTTLGGRYQVETSKSVRSSSNIETTTGFVPLFTFLPASTQVSAFKPKVSLEVRPWDDVLAYASWQQAQKSGTYNVISVFQQPTYVKPEEITAREIGVKSRLFGGLVTFNAAAFDYDIKNQQVQFISQFNGGIVFENAGAARVHGVDFDSVVQLFPSMVDGLVLNASGAWLDGVYTNYTGGRGYDETPKPPLFPAGTGLPFKNGNYTGNPTVRTPKFSGTLSLSKTFEFDSSVFEIAGDGYYNSGFYFNPQHSDRDKQNAYHVFNARLSYLYKPWGLRATFFGSNLTDALSYLGQLRGDWGRLDVLAPPRTFGGRLNWDF